MSQSDPLGVVLVTGGCGFLGSHIVRLLAERYPKPATTLHVVDLHVNRNLHPEATYHAGDLTDGASVRDVLAKVKPQVVIHTASPVFSTVTGKSRELMHRVNVEGTRNLLQASQEAGVRAFVYTSSASVISDTRTSLVNADERWSLIRGELQLEYYSDTKAEAEELVIAHNSPDGDTPFLTAAIRPSAIFGEGDVQLAPNMINVLKTGRTAWQLGSNDNLFDFTYVGNVAHAHVLAARRLLEAHTTLSTVGRQPLPAEEDAKVDADSTRVDGQAFLITNGAPVYFWDFARGLWAHYHRLDTAATAPAPATLRQTRVLPDGLAILLASVASFFCWLLRRPEPNLTPARVRYSCMTRFYSIRKAERRLGYAPIVELDDAVARTARWFFEQDAAAAAKKGQ